MEGIFACHFAKRLQIQHREDVNETDRERKAVQKEMETLQAERSRYK